jgi:hypothetical protein
LDHLLEVTRELTTPVMHVNDSRLLLIQSRSSHQGDEINGVFNGSFEGDIAHHRMTHHPIEYPSYVCCLVHIISFTVSFRISIQVLIMKNEMIIQIYHSIQIWKKMLIKAAIRVDNAIKQSFIASAPLALKLPEFSFFHSFL